MRTAVILTVLALGLSPNTTLVCNTACQRAHTVAGGCHDDDSGGVSGWSMLGIGRDGCTTFIEPSAFVREDPRPNDGVSRTAHAAIVPAVGVAPALAASGEIDGVTWAGAFSNRPRITALRI